MTYTHKVFETRREALRWLVDHALCSVGWPEGAKRKEACYWNGKVLITPAIKVRVTEK